MHFYFGLSKYFHICFTKQGNNITPLCCPVLNQSGAKIVYIISSFSDVCFWIFPTGIITLFWRGKAWISYDNSVVAVIPWSHSGPMDTVTYPRLFPMRLWGLCSKFRLLWSSIHFSMLLCQEKLLPVWGLLSSWPNVSAVTSQASCQTAQHAQAALKGRRGQGPVYSCLCSFK